MSEVPEHIEELVRQRETARAAKDFDQADALRDRIAAAGFDVVDTPEGTHVVPQRRTEEERTVHVSPSEVPSVLDQPIVHDATVHWLSQGWPEDIVRGIESFHRNAGDLSVQHVVVDLTEGQAWPGQVEVVWLRPEVGWAGGRNAGLRRSAGRIVVVVDGSVEAEGDVLGPLTEALANQEVGVTGPFGIVSDDLHEFRESPGPDVDAVEGYLLAFRRELAERGLRFDEKFKFYRTADIELSFQVKAMGLRATVTPVPVRKHVHRMWASTPENERARLSKRNFYRFLDRWRGRTDLLVSNQGRDRPRRRA
jgi:GT2 family glycosyltransferase